MKVKFPEECQTSVSEATAAAVAANSSDTEEGRGPEWRPEEEFDPLVSLVVTNSPNAPSGTGSDDPRFSHLQSIIRTGFGRGMSEIGVETFWRKTIDSPNAFPPEFSQLFLQSNLTGLGDSSATPGRSSSLSSIHIASPDLAARRWFLGVEEFLVARRPCRGVAEATTWQARFCHRSGAQVNHHQPLVHALSRAF